MSDAPYHQSGLGNTNAESSDAITDDKQPTDDGKDDSSSEDEPVNESLVAAMAGSQVDQSLDCYDQEWVDEG